MFEKIKSRWGVNGLNFFLIIVTFALGGSACAAISRKILSLFELDRGLVWVIIYIVLITLLWPVCVLLISIPFFQFAFFKKYLQKIWSRFTSNQTDDVQKGCAKIAIFASSKGSNANNIIYYFKNNQHIRVACIVTENPVAGVIEIGNQYKIPVIILPKDAVGDGIKIMEIIKTYSVDYIVLAGYLKLIPSSLIQLFPNRIINIHPALLPAYGGKGMYGMRVHEAVIRAREEKSGITIHWVNEVYDEGEVIFQESVKVEADETPESLVRKIHELEHKHYPAVIEKIIEKKIKS